MLISPEILAALTLHNAQRCVSDRRDGSWWIIDTAKWDVIHSIPAGPGHRFVLAVINSHNDRAQPLYRD